MADKIVLVIAYDEPEASEALPFQEMIERARELFEGKPGVEVYGAIKEKAREILDALGE